MVLTIIRIIWFRNFVHRSTFRRAGKNLGNLWITVLSAAPTGAQASTTLKLGADTDQRSETTAPVGMSRAGSRKSPTTPPSTFPKFSLQFKCHGIQTCWANLMVPLTTPLALIAASSYFTLHPRHFTPHLITSVSFRGIKI